MKMLPLGIQTFKTIINQNYLYVDKTQYIYNLISQGRYYFISRPHRFGKSLFVSTLKEVFSGNKHLFSKLWLGSSNYDWCIYPIIHIDFSNIAHRTPEQLELSIIEHLVTIGYEHNIDIGNKISPESALKALVKALHDKIGPVIILVDEYDKPILDHVGTLEKARAQQAILRDFYAAIKSVEDYLRFIFMTGITKFSKTSVFSGLNNLQDLTLNPEGASILGYTQQEIDYYFIAYIKEISKKQNVSSSVVTQNLKFWYNGYQFSEKLLKIYNPYSVLLYLSSGRLLNYWFDTGTPSFLVKLIKTQHYPIEAIEGSQLSVLDIDSFEIDKIKLIPLLLQTGYLTIDTYQE